MPGYVELAAPIYLRPAHAVGLCVLAAAGPEWTAVANTRSTDSLTAFLFALLHELRTVFFGVSTEIIACIGTAEPGAAHARADDTLHAWRMRRDRRSTQQRSNEASIASAGTAVKALLRKLLRLTLRTTLVFHHPLSPVLLPPRPRVSASPDASPHESSSAS